jgi:hypothetical protein
MTRAAALSAHDTRRVAVEAGCDPRTVTAILAGRPSHSTSKARVRDALVKLGLTPRVTIPDAEPEPREEKAK